MLNTDSNHCPAKEYYEIQVQYHFLLATCEVICKMSTGIDRTPHLVKMGLHDEEVDGKVCDTY